MHKRSLLLIAGCALFLAGCNQLTGTPASPSPVLETMMEASPSPDSELMMEDEEALMTSPKVYTLTEQNDLGQTGTMTMTETADGKTSVVLAMSGGTFTQPQPAHIHVGACPKPGAVKYPLTNVVDGESTTIIDMSIDEILASSPTLAVNVHKSAAESSVYTACADLK